ncbi:hypothetical protein [Agromyces silvae]|uniref:hypothetical protein n=1 Tax=Agromyces silvae TaxID=3388266 RepID=UPI00280BBEDB|nr:hypothetical protein [Agromyces protaetiae]
MNTGRIATFALAVFAVAGVVGTVAVWQAGNASAVLWSGREPGDAALMAFALLQISYGLGLPAFATLAAASAFALVVIGARAVSVRWVEREVRAAAPAQVSERRTDDERVRLDVEVRRDE